MYCTRNVTEQVIWVGGSDRRLALFENLFPIPRGISYNSYLILDEKTALIDTVDASISRQFFENLYAGLHGRNLDYLVINHMEPDHCANIEELSIRFPGLTIVGNQKTLGFVRQFYGAELKVNTMAVQEYERVCLGRHVLQFYFAPMVHWPEVMMTYEETEQLLFTADGFGSFGALNGALFNDEVDFERDWLPDARRYYGNIVGKYGMQVQQALKKVSGLSIRMICPLHGPVWRSNLDFIFDKYEHWSRYEPEEKTVAILYGSMYGNTENAVNVLAAGLVEAGVRNLGVYDVSSTHVSVLIGEIFRCSHLVLAAPTYNNGVYPAMLNLLHDMKALNVQNRTVALIDNGSWAPFSTKQMKEVLGEMNGIRVLEENVVLRTSLKEDTGEGLRRMMERILGEVF